MSNYAFKIILLIYIVACGIIRMPLMKKCKHNKNKKSLNAKFEKTKVFIAWLGMCFVPFIYIFTNLLNRFEYNIPISIRIICSIGLVANTVLFYYVHKELNDNWSAVLEVKEEQKLIQTGIYKYIRHPMYTQSWIWVILQGIVSANFFVLIFGIVTWGFMYFTRIETEEKMLIEEFGDKYLEYTKTTGRLLPKM